MSAASFLHSSFLQAINAVMLWLVRAEKVPQASEHLCPAKLQTRCDICSACQSIYPFIPTDSGVPRTVDPQKSLQPKRERIQHGQWVGWIGVGGRWVWMVLGCGGGGGPRLL